MPAKSWTKNKIWRSKSEENSEPKREYEKTTNIYEENPEQQKFYKRRKYLENSKPKKEYEKKK